MPDTTPPSSPVTLVEDYPLYAIVSTGTFLNNATTTAHIFLTQNGQPLIAQNSKYLCSQGLQGL